MSSGQVQAQGQEEGHDQGQEQNKDRDNDVVRTVGKESQGLRTKDKKWRSNGRTVSEHQHNNKVKNKVKEKDKDNHKMVRIKPTPP